MATAPCDGGNGCDDLLFALYKKEVGVFVHLVLCFRNFYIFYLICFLVLLASEAFEK